MALIVGTIYKRLIAAPDEKWTNVYMLNTTNAGTAIPELDQIADWEAVVLGETAEIYRLSARPKVGGQSVVSEVNKPGLQVVANPDERLPMWNTAKITFSNIGGRPEVKYLRLPLYLDMVDGLTLKTAVRTALNLDYVANLDSFTPYVGPNGEIHNGGEVAPLIQMRQTDWHRRTRPGFKRGWVPV